MGLQAPNQRSCTLLRDSPRTCREHGKGLPRCEQSLRVYLAIACIMALRQSVVQLGMLAMGASSGTCVAAPVACMSFLGVQGANQTWAICASTTSYGQRSLNGGQQAGSWRTAHARAHQIDATDSAAPCTSGGVALEVGATSSTAPLALLIDAAGTLIVPSEDTADVYLRYGRRYGVALSHQQVLDNFRRAYNTPWSASPSRYVGDARDFWRWIIAESLCCDNPTLAEEIYAYYEDGAAWRLAPGAEGALRQLRRAGLKLAVVSNFDTRLRRILRSLGVDSLFDAVVVSAEVGTEKPNPLLFTMALEAVGGIAPDRALHVGDDRRNDIWGARDAGVAALLWGVDVRSFESLARRVLRGTSAWDLLDDDEEEEEEQEQVLTPRTPERHHPQHQQDTRPFSSANTTTTEPDVYATA